MTRRARLQLLFSGLLAVAAILATSTAARAQGFISPLIGYDFSGDANCPNITGCTEKRLNLGAGLGTMGDIFGFEEEFAYATNFFGEAPGLSSSVLTVMSNLMVVPKIGPARPYVLAGVGLIKTHVEFTPTSILTSDDNMLGWDLGGGVMVLFSEHVGVRGDIRHFHSFQDLSLPRLTVNNPKFDFGRASAALVFTF